jgi:hypothetical protein
MKALAGTGSQDRRWGKWTKMQTVGVHSGDLTGGHANQLGYFNCRPQKSCDILRETKMRKVKFAFCYS